MFRAPAPVREIFSEAQGTSPLLHVILRNLLRSSLGILLVLLQASCVSTREVFHVGEMVSETAPMPRRTPSHFVCWNVHKASDDRFVREVRDLLSDIPKEDGVILCLQEVRSSTFDLIKDLHREDVSGHYAPSWKNPLSGRTAGVLTVGNRSMPASGVERIHIPGCEMLVVSPKVALRSEVPVEGGRRLQVINCHGLIFVSEAVFAEQLDRVFLSLRDRSQPAIVCGDFNVWSEARLEMLRERARVEGLTEARSRTPGSSPAPQWLRGLKSINGFDPDIPLDRIFTRGVEVLDCYSVENSLSSDHLPLVLRFVVDTGPSG